MAAAFAGLLAFAGWLADLRAAWRDGPLLLATINPEGRVRVARGPAVADVPLGRARRFLVRIENHSGGQPALRLLTRHVGGEPNPISLRLLPAPDGDPLRGLPVEFRWLEVHGERAGRRELTIGLDAGQGTQDLGFRGEAPVLFNVRGPIRGSGWAEDWP